jgi:hypothetical protein
MPLELSCFDKHLFWMSSSKSFYSTKPKFDRDSTKYYLLFVGNYNYAVLKDLD